MCIPDRAVCPPIRADLTAFFRPARQRGISLIELIMFIIIVSIGVVALLAVFATTSRKSSDPVIQKQMLAIAESLLEEVQSKPFTYCDPDDPQAGTAQSASVGPTGCEVQIEAIGPEAKFPSPTFGYQPNDETRSSTNSPFDNVNDYGPSLTINPFTDVTGTTTIAGYGATVNVATSSALNGLPNTEVLLVTVTVTGPGNSSLSLEGYRARYAPNSVP